MDKKILIIDDSTLMRMVIFDIIKTNKDCKVVDLAKNGEDGLAKIQANPQYYDLVITNIQMIKMTGLELLEHLQKSHINVKVIVVSSVALDGASETIRALELGAFEFITRPKEFGNYMNARFRQKLLNAVEAALNDSSDDVTAKTRQASKPVGSIKGQKLVAIACSTGGPKALQQVISMLPSNLDAPVVVVQHMPKGFTTSLAGRLNEIGSIKVSEAVDGEILEKGHVYIAPGGMHIEIVKKGNSHCIQYNDSPAVNALKPCANIMYQSLEKTTFDEIICVVMTGMGADGTDGIKYLTTRKKIRIVAQDVESCVVYGMPKAIAKTGLVNVICPLDEIANTIVKNVGVS